MANLDLKKAAKSAGVKLWQVSDSLGIADTTFSKWLRYELPEYKKKEILGIIDELSEEAS